jgi:uncharacterized protein YecE (DUF72 family)
MQQRTELYTGCAGWAIPGRVADRFPGEGSHLQRYASRLPAVEINSSFYRAHRPSTYARWAASVHDAFRFAVKVPRTVTHMARLSDPSPLEEFLAGVDALGAKLGPLLVQLPRSLAFDPAVVSAFVAALRQGFGGGVVCEPRHPSWFTPEVDEVLASYEVARVAADPPPVADGAKPGGWPGLVYYRLHGSPRRYYSAYPDGFVEDLSRRLAAASEAVPAWCIFDNTAGGAATENALALWQRLQRR